jgi:essential nuclear protein 1
MPRTTKGAQKSRHDPLLVQLGEDELEAKYGRLSEPGKRKKSRKTDDDEEKKSEVIQ